MSLPRTLLTILNAAVSRTLPPQRFWCVIERIPVHVNIPAVLYLRAVIIPKHNWCNWLFQSAHKESHDGAPSSPTANSPEGETFTVRSPSAYRTRTQSCVQCIVRIPISLQSNLRFTIQPVETSESSLTVPAATTTGATEDSSGTTALSDLVQLDNE